MICKLNKYKERSTRRRKWKKKEVEKEERKKWQEREGGKQVLKKDFKLQPEILINLTVTINIHIYAVQCAVSSEFHKNSKSDVLYNYTYA